MKDAFGVERNDISKALAGAGKPITQTSKLTRIIRRQQLKGRIPEKHSKQEIFNNGVRRQQRKEADAVNPDKPFRVTEGAALRGAFKTDDWTRGNPTKVKNLNVGSPNKDFADEVVGAAGKKKFKRPTTVTEGNAGGLGGAAHYDYNAGNLNTRTKNRVFINRKTTEGNPKARDHFIHHELSHSEKFAKKPGRGLRFARDPRKAAREEGRVDGEAANFVQQKYKTKQKKVYSAYPGMLGRDYHKTYKKVTGERVNWDKSTSHKSVDDMPLPPSTKKILHDKVKRSKMKEKGRSNPGVANWTQLKYKTYAQGVKETYPRETKALRNAAIGAGAAGTVAAPFGMHANNKRLDRKLAEKKRGGVSKGLPSALRTRAGGVKLMQVAGTKGSSKRLGVSGRSTEDTYIQSRVLRNAMGNKARGQSPKYRMKAVNAGKNAKKTERVAAARLERRR